MLFPSSAHSYAYARFKLNSNLLRVRVGAFTTKFQLGSHEDIQQHFRVEPD